MAKKVNLEHQPRKASSVIKTSIVSVIFILYMFPFLLVLVNSLKRKVNIVKHPLQILDDAGLQWVYYKNAIEKMDFIRSFGNSFIITAVSVVLLIVFSSMAAYIFVRTLEGL